MESLSPRIHPDMEHRSPTLRDILTPIFRQRRLVVISFLGILGGTLLWTLLSPKQYQAQMKLLVKRERVDNGLARASAEVSEEEINSEVELLKSRDLLEKVVVQCGLDRHAEKSLVGPLHDLLRGSRANPEVSSERKTSEAARILEKRLQIAPLKKTSLIAVTYENSDPHLAAAVLETVANQYLAKHVAVYQTPGASTFFKSESERYQKQLDEAENRLTDFNDKQGIVVPELEVQIALQKMGEFYATLRSSQVAIDETEKRIKKIEDQLDTIPSRETAQVRTADNAILLQQLKGTLLNLELKRTELLENFNPEYRPVQEVEKEITQTLAAIRSAESTPIQEETIDRDPTHEWLREELAKARTDLDALHARSVATARVVQAYQEGARAIDDKGTVQQGLVREAKGAEDSYVLYRRKAEEARISDALDQQRIVNVAIAEAPTVPAAPSRPLWPWSISLGGVLAGFLSVGLAFASDYLDPSLRTPDELQRYLDIPVIAALPEEPK